MEIQALGSDVLEANLKRLLSTERTVQVAFLRHLIEFGRRALYRKHGYPTLWQYCLDELRLSKFQTFHRTNAARIVERCPIVAEYLEDGRVCITTLVLLRDVLTEANARETLDATIGRSRDEVLLLVAAMNPMALPERATIRALPDRRPILVPAPSPPALPRPWDAPAAVGTPTTAAPAQDPAPSAERIAIEPPPRRTFEAKPASPQQVSVHLVVSPQFMELLERARSVLSHSIPTRDVAAVLERCLRTVVDQAAKRGDPAALLRHVVSSTPQDPDRSYISASLERQVRQRDNGRCAALTASGICGSTHRLEIHHVVPVGKGGKTTLENLLLVCRDHNQMYARLDFGDAFIDAKIGGAREAAAVYGEASQFDMST